MQYVKMYTVFILQLQVYFIVSRTMIHFPLACLLASFLLLVFLGEQAILPCGTISDGYANGSNEEQVYSNPNPWFYNILEIADFQISFMKFRVYKLVFSFEQSNSKCDFTWFLMFKFEFRESYCYSTYNIYNSSNIVWELKFDVGTIKLPETALEIKEVRLNM